jgi:hypothetical protein
MMSVMIPNSGVGHELQKLLREKLNIPDRVRWFEVRFALNEPVSVKCEFYPEVEADMEDRHATKVGDRWLPRDLAP